MKSIDLSMTNRTGPIPDSVGNLSRLSNLSLETNRLSGPIPDALARLSELTVLSINDNDFVPGPVPAWIASLGKLQYLVLGRTGRTVPFPAWLTSLPDLLYLDLGRNAFAGPLPDMTFPKLRSLHIQSNALSLLDENAPGPDDPGPGMPGCDIRWNAIAARDQKLRAYFDLQQPGWELTQTIAPSGVVASDVGSSAVVLSWAPIAYAEGGGGYRVLVATQPGGPYAVFGTTPSKSTTSQRVTGLSPSTRYHLALQAVTPAHANNSNTVESRVSAEVSVTTGSAPCPPLAAPAFTSAPSGPVTAGATFTVAWSPVVQADPAGTYQVDLAANDACASPLRVVVSQPSITVATSPGTDATYCVAVPAVGGRGCVSPASPALRVTVKAPPATFVVVAPQAPAATAAVGQPVTATSTVVFRNTGAGPGVLTLAAVGGFFAISPAGPLKVAPRDSVTATIAFGAEASATAGVTLGAAVGLWMAGGEPASVSTPVALTVLSGPPSAGGARLEAVGTNEVHFRAAPGATPDPLTVTIRNAGANPARLSPAIGPGGGWLRIAGDLATPLAPGTERTFTLTVARSSRTAGDGTTPLLTGLTIDNVDGEPEDAALFTVFDEEPPPIEPGAGRQPLGPGEFSLVVGSGVSATGANETLYLSDGWPRNRGSEGADGIAGPSLARSRITLAPYATYRLADFVKGIFGATGSGHVEIRSKALPQLSVRATADAITDKNGTLARYGGEVPVLLSGQGATPEATAVIAGVRGPEAGFRTNVILAETSGAPAEVEVALYAPDGTLAGTVIRGVKAWSKEQVNASDAALFPPGRPFDGGTLEVRRLSGEGTVAAFATAIDGVSGSFATRVGQLVPTAAARRAPLKAAEPDVFYLPAAAHAAAANDSFYRTTLVVANPTLAQARLSLTYLPDGGAPVGPKELLLGGRAEGPKAVVLEDVVERLFGVTTSTAGMTRFEGDVRRVLAASETWTYLDVADPAKGRSVSSLNPAPGSDLTRLGVFGATAREVIGARESGAEQRVVSHPAIEEGRAYRTNLILGELSGKPATVRVRLTPKAASGTVLPQRDYSLDANQRRQVNRVVRELLGEQGKDADQRELEISVEAVSGEGRVLAIVTKVDNAPASKRADIFTLGGAVSQGAIGAGR